MSATYLVTGQFRLKRTFRLVRLLSAVARKGANGHVTELTPLKAAKELDLDPTEAETRTKLRGS